MSVEHKPRLCHMVRDASGYGFHLHGEKGKSGQLIRKVEADSPAERAGLKEGDRIIAVNGKNVENEEHHEVVLRIKEKSGETTMLVIDAEADQYFKDKNIPVTEELLHSTPDVAPPPAKINSNDQKELRPRFCHLVRGAKGFGFNLHSEKGKQGSFIKSVEPDGPSEAAGLKSGDRIVEINGQNFEYEQHNALVTAIKESGSEVDMLVVDEETDHFFKDIQVTPTAEHVTGPLPTRQENPVSEEPKTAVDDAPKSTPATKSTPAPPPPTAEPPASNGVPLPDMDLASLKEKARSSRKKAAPDSKWNNRQAIFNNL